MRLCCSGYIINLVVKAILYGKRLTDFSQAIAGCSDDESFVLWRQFGTIGKLHNCVKSIMRIYQWRQAFIALQTEQHEGEKTIFWNVDMLLVKDGGIRWNSTYYMLFRAYELRRTIELYQLRYKPSRNEPKSPYSTINDRITSAD